MSESSLSSRLYARYRSAPPVTAGGLEAERAARRLHLRAAIAAHFPPDRAIRGLDLGCGAGLLLAEARALGYHALRGIDHAPEQVAAAAALGVEAVTAGDLLACLRATPPASLDLVIAFDVLEHVRRDDLLAVADAILAALVPGGRLLLHLPNAASPFGGRVVYGDLTHETAFTPGSLGQLLAAAGFTAITCHEDRPAAPGLKGVVRRAGWRLIRAALRLCIALETGARDPDMVLTQCFYATAHRPPEAVPA